MTWWEQVQKTYIDGLAAADLTMKADLERAFASGATTPAEQQRVIDQTVAAIEDPAVRAEMVAHYEKMRADLEASLRASGYEGDLDSLTLAELAALDANRGLATVEGDGLPTRSGLAAAAAGELATGRSEVDPESGSITIYDQLGNVHDYIPAGQKAPPASTIFDEIAAGAERGGPRPMADQVSAAIEALLDKGWDPGNPGDAGFSLEPNGDVVATFPDGSTSTFEHDALAQAKADLDTARGNAAEVGGVLDRTATGLGEGLVAGIASGIDNLAGSWGWPGGGTAGTGGAGGTGNTNGGTGNTGGGGSNTGAAGGTTNAKPPTRPEATSDLDDFDDFDANTGGSADKPASTGQKTEPAAATPEETTTTTPPKKDDGENTFMTEAQQEAAADAAAGPATEEDGWDSSKTEPPTDGTYVDSDGDGIADEDEEEDAEEDEDSATAVGYTPRPGDDVARNLTKEQLAELLAAGRGGYDPDGGTSDRTNVKPTEFDPAMMVAAQAQKQRLIGNPGSPDLDPTSGGTYNPPPPVTDDDTPGHTPAGRDGGAEDRMQDQQQGTLDWNEISGGSNGSGGSGGSSGGTSEGTPEWAPLGEMLVADVSIDGPEADQGSAPAIPDQFGYVAGSPGSSGAGSSSTDTGMEPDASPFAPREMVQAEINLGRAGGSPPAAIPDPYGYVAGGPSPENDEASSVPATGPFALEIIEMEQAEINVATDDDATSVTSGRPLSGRLSMSESIDLPEFDSDDLPSR